MVFGILTSGGMLVSLVGAVMLYRFTPYMFSEEGYFNVNELPEKESILRRHRWSWGVLGVGFLLQLVGSLGWLFAPSAAPAKGVLSLILTL